MTYLLTQMALYMLCALLLGVILGWLIWGRLAQRLRNCQADRAKLSAELKSRGNNTEDRARIAKLESEISNLEGELDTSRRERANLRDQVDSLRDATASNAAAVAATATAAPLVSTGATSQPQGLSAARNGRPDDLKLIKGVGPKLARMLHGMGYYHFDQIAAWTASDVAWVDENLEGFTGRVSRDEWVKQARALAGRS